MNFRTETFLEHAKKKGVTGFVVIIIIGATLMLTLLYLSGSGMADAWFGYVFIVLGVGFQIFWIYRYDYQHYHNGKLAYLDHGNEIPQVLLEVGVFTRKHAPMKHQYFPARAVTQYVFDIADVILCERSMLILGKSRMFKSPAWVAPLELSFKPMRTRLANALITGWQEKGSRIEMKFLDPNYKSEMIMEFKTETETIRQWLELRTNNILAGK